MSLPALERRVVVCVGTGGVGKTTLAAAMALEAARSGRRAAVVTIDPARRLADALGVEELGNRPEPLPRQTLTALGVPETGSLSALMLDRKRTFDDLVARFAEDEATRQRILANPIYRHASDALAGSSEYAAMEKVYELAQSSEFDTLVVDTPPSQHALDFLDAPERMIEFLDSKLVQLFIHPAMAAGRAGFRWFQWGARRALSVIERVTGVGFLEDLSEFLMAFEHMSEGFRERAREVRALLLGPDSAFVLVASPETESAQQALQFLSRLESKRVPVAGIVMNRVRLWPEAAAGAEPRVPSADAASAADLAALAGALRAAHPGALPAEQAARAALDAAARYAAVVRRDARALDGFRDRSSFLRAVPEFTGDVHDLEGLARVAAALVDPGATLAAAAATDAGRDGAGQRSGGAESESASI